MNTITVTKKKKRKSVSYAKWGYIFIAPFFIVFAVFALIPLISTFYNSFFQNYMIGLQHVGPKFIGFQNYQAIFSNADIWKYLSNTLVIWILGFIPQIVISLLLAAWFTDLRLRLKSAVFKRIIYMPNIIMAAALSMLFFAVFANNGPVNNILIGLGIQKEPYEFLTGVEGSRGLIALMNFLLWFGNTTILLMAGIMGIDTSLFEAAQIDGARPFQMFRKVTLPLLKPILIYVLITSLIGGLQLFDIPQILTNGEGVPNEMNMTLVMYLYRHLYSKNFGMAGAVSVLLFIVTAILSVVVFKTVTGGRKEKGEIK